jgi:hypothetical protein
MDTMKSVLGGSELGSGKSTNAAVQAVGNPLQLSKMTKSYLRNVVVNTDTPAFIVGWYDDVIMQLIEVIKNGNVKLPAPPSYWIEDEEELTPM